MNKSVSLKGRNVSGDEAIRKVISAEARLQTLESENRALKKDRDQILSELIDSRKKRPVPRAPSPGKPPKADTVRVSAGDVHGMMMDKAAVAAFLSDVKRLNPDEVVLLGDILEAGGFLAKHHTIGYVALCDFTYAEDIEAANWFLDELQKAAPNAVIHFLAGNHSDRIERWVVDEVMSNKRDAQFLLDAFGPQTLLRLRDRNIRYYQRSEIYVEGLPRGWIRLGKMMFTHELGTSKNAAREAVGKTAGNVTFGHSHREDSATIVFPGVGICKAFNPGCLSQIQPIWRHSDPTSWSQGYAIDIVAKSGNFQRIHVPIWRGESLAGAMIERFKS